MTTSPPASTTVSESPTIIPSTTESEHTIELRKTFNDFPLSDVQQFCGFCDHLKEDDLPVSLEQCLTIHLSWILTFTTITLFIGALIGAVSITLFRFCRRRCKSKSRVSPDTPKRGEPNLCATKDDLLTVMNATLKYHKAPPDFNNPKFYLDTGMMNSKCKSLILFVP